MRSQASAISAGTRPVERRIHLGLSIRGALHLSNRELRGWLMHDDGREMTPLEARNALMDELAQGREVLPIGDCDSWDYKTGCPGHPETEEVAHA